MRRRIFTALFILAMTLFTLSASKQNDEIKRMGDSVALCRMEITIPH